MTYEVGQEVIIRKALKKRGEYYHGGTLRDVPLGTKGKIDAVREDTKIIRLKLKGEYGYEQWAVHPDEISLDAAAEAKEKEQANDLETLLSAGEMVPLAQAKSIVAPAKATPEIRKAENPVQKISLWRRIAGYLGFRKQLENYQAVENVNQENRGALEDDLLIKELLEEGQSYSEGKETSFNPKFNVTEEFVVWMREQFPDLKKKYSFGGEYTQLEKRMEEVRKAAVQASEQGVETTDSCIKRSFESYLDYFNNKRNKDRFIGNLTGLVNLIESVSVNLVSKHWHYGTYLKDGRKSPQ